MPKGGDIHSHLTGAIYAESYIRWAVDDGLCLERSSLALVAPPCEPTSARIPASAILANAPLYDDVIDAWSLRNWHPAQGTGQDQFANAFLKFRARDRTGDMLAEVTTRAAGQRIGYMELLLGPRLDAVMALGRRVDWNGDADSSRARLLAAGLLDTLAQVAPMLDSAEERRREMVKQVHRRAEEARVEVRNRRREAADVLKKALRDGELSEDEERREFEALQRLTDRFIEAIDARSERKEAEILEV